MPISFRDFLAFPFNQGRGIRTSQLDGLIAESQLHPDAGIPSYVISPTSYTYDEANAVLGASLAGVIPAGQRMPTSIIFGFAPALADLPRAADDMTVTFGTHLQPVTAVRHYTGIPLKARDLTPGQLMEGFFVANQFTLLEPLRQRPQDYVVAAVLGEDAGDLELAADELATTRAAFSAIDEHWIDVQAAKAAAGATTSGTRWIWLGVPVDAPDLAWFTTTPTAALADEATSGVTITSSSRYTTVEPPYNGVPYKWWRRRQSWNATRNFVTFGHRAYP